MKSSSKLIFITASIFALVSLMWFFWIKDSITGAIFALGAAVEYGIALCKRKK